MLPLAGLPPGVVGARAAGSPAQRLIAVLRSASALRVRDRAFGVWHVVLRRRGMNPGPNRSNLHDETRRTKRSHPFGRERKRKADGAAGSGGGERFAPPATEISSCPATSTSTNRADVSRASLPRSSRRLNEAQANGVRGGPRTAPVSPARPMSCPANAIEASTRWCFGLRDSPPRCRSGLWGTYKQWQEAGAQVRQGERSTTVVLWREIRILPAAQ